MGYAGTAAVSALTDAKETFDPDFIPPALAQDPSLAAAGWAFFMGFSSNARYQSLAGAETTAYAAARSSGLPWAVSAAAGLSVFLRFINNVVGSGQWLDIAEELGVSAPRADVQARTFLDSLSIIEETISRAKSNLQCTMQKETARWGRALVGLPLLEVPDDGIRGKARERQRQKSAKTRAKEKMAAANAAAAKRRSNAKAKMVAAKAATVKRGGKVKAVARTRAP